MNKKAIVIASVLVVAAAIAIVALITGNIPGGKLFGSKADRSVMAQTTETAVDDAQGQEASGETTDTNSTESNAADVSRQSTNQSSTKNSSGNNVGNRKKVKVKAIYLSGMSAGSSKILDHYIDMINKTELNAVVIDIKEYAPKKCLVNYESSVPMVVQNKLFQKLYDPEKVLKKLHDNGIYVIGRIVCFRDNGLAAAKPELAVKRLDGSAWSEGNLGPWLNAYKEETWDYNISIAKEAVEKGFDEIQFDYVRFPTASKKDVDYGTNPPVKSEAISGFLKKAADVLNKEMGVPVSADVFGIIAESPGDAKAIGQNLDKVGMNLDYISPMVYPSHFANAAKKGFLANGSGQMINGIPFTAPDLKPYEVVHNALLGIKKVITAVPGYKASVRPYLQDFTATYLPNGYYQEYGPEQVRQQIKAVYDAGYEQWIMWDGRNKYDEASFEKEPAQ